MDVIFLWIEKGHNVDIPHTTIYKTLLFHVSYPTNIDLTPVNKYLLNIYDYSQHITIEKYFDDQRNHLQLDAWAHFYYFKRKDGCLIL